MIYNIKTPNKAEKLIFNAFKKALSEDKLRLYIDYSKLNRPGSPVYDPWENLLPILTPTIIGLLLIISSNVIIGLSFIVIMLMIYSSYLKKYFSHRLIERTKNYIIYESRFSTYFNLYRNYAFLHFLSAMMVILSFCPFTSLRWIGSLCPLCCCALWR